MLKYEFLEKLFISLNGIAKNFLPRKEVQKRGGMQLQMRLLSLTARTVSKKLNYAFIKILCIFSSIGKIYEKGKATYLNSICQGNLAGSVRRPSDSSSRGQEFEPHAGVEII